MYKKRKEDFIVCVTLYISSFRRPVIIQCREVVVCGSLEVKLFQPRRDQFSFGEVLFYYLGHSIFLIDTCGPLYNLPHADIFFEIGHHFVVIFNMWPIMVKTHEMKRSETTHASRHDNTYTAMIILVNNSRRSTFEFPGTKTSLSTQNCACSRKGFLGPLRFFSAVSPVA